MCNDQDTPTPRQKNQPVSTLFLSHSLVVTDPQLTETFPYNNQELLSFLGDRNLKVTGMESCGRSMLGPKRGVVIKGSLVAQIVKDACAVLEAQLSFLGREDPLGRKWQPTPAFLPGISHGQRSLAGYSP